MPRPQSLALLAASLLLPSVAFAQDRFDDATDDWRFRTSLYAFVQHAIERGNAGALFPRFAKKKAAAA